MFKVLATFSFVNKNLQRALDKKMTTQEEPFHSDSEMSKIPDRYFTPAEVELHNAPTDLWLSWLGHVYDLTKLAEEYKGGLFANLTFKPAFLYIRYTSLFNTEQETHL